MLNDVLLLKMDEVLLGEIRRKKQELQEKQVMVYNMFSEWWALATLAVWPGNVELPELVISQWLTGHFGPKTLRPRA